MTIPHFQESIVKSDDTLQSFQTNGVHEDYFYTVLYSPIFVLSRLLVKVRVYSTENER